jgi:hypothetical protein
MNCARRRFFLIWATRSLTLRVTPVMEAGISDHVWSLEEIVVCCLDSQATLDLIFYNHCHAHFFTNLCGYSAHCMGISRLVWGY